MRELFSQVTEFCDDFLVNDNFVTIKTSKPKELSIYLFNNLDCDLATVVADKEGDGVLIKYLYSYPKEDYFFIVEQFAKDSFESFAQDIPALNWFEREIRDLFGLELINHPDDRALCIYPENFPKGFHPFKDEIPNEEVFGEYEYKDIKSEGVYVVPVGPIHAGVIEPGHFRFSMSGEPILQLEVRHFWKHRGIEKLSEGKSIDEVLQIAERISGDNTVAHALSYVLSTSN